MLKPRIFISSVTRELASARQLVANTLIAIGYEPIWQDIFPTDAGDLREMLRGKIDTCSAVLQLVGDAYGAEPPSVDSEFGRVSYTQYEALYAESIGHKKKVYYLFLDASFPRDNAPEVVDKLASDTSSNQYEERRKLQADYKERIRKSGTLRSRYGSVSDLESGIFKLRNDLDKLRRNTRMVLAAIFAILALIVGGVYAVWRTQGKQEESLVSQNSKLDEINAEQKKQREMLREFASTLNQVPKTGENENQEQRLKTAYKILEEKFKLPSGSLETKLQKVATDILEQSDAPPLDRANAFVVQGKYADAEQEALKARDKALAAAKQAIYEAVDALNLAGDAAFELGEYGRTLEHFQGAAALLNPEKDFDRWSFLQNGIGQNFLNVDNFTEALPVLSQNYEKRLAKYGPDDERTGVSLNNLAGYYRQHGEPRKALPLYQKGLQSLEKSVGPEHENTLQAMNSLATTQGNLGNYPEALKLHEETLALREKVLGKDHLATAESLGNIAEVYRDTGEYKKALPIALRSIEIRRRVLGDQHPLLAVSLSNLGLIYTNTKEFDKAKPCFEEAIAIQEKIFGKDSVTTAFTIGNYATMYQAQGKHNEALLLLEKVLDIFEKHLEKDNLRLGYTQNNIGMVNLEQGEFDKALIRFERAIAIFEKASGRENIDAAIVINNIGLAHFRKNEFEKTLPYYIESLAIYRKKLGDKNSNTRSNIQGLVNAYLAQAGLLLEQKKYDEALLVREKALVLQEELFGKEHLDVGHNINYIGLLHFRKTEYEKAVPYFVKASGMFEKLQGEEYIANNTVKLNLAKTYQRLNDFKSALPILERLLVIHTQAKSGEAKIAEIQKLIDEVKAQIKKSEEKSSATPISLN